MNRVLWNSALGVCLGLVMAPGDALAGRGGGYGGGRGGYGGGRGGYGGQMGGGDMSHSPSFSTPRPPTGGSGSRPGGEGAYGNRSGSGENAGAGYANRNQGQPNHSNAASAAAGAGYSNRNQGQPNHSNAASAAAGAGYSNRNQGQPNHSNAASAAAGAGYSNRNQGQPNHSNAASAAAGAGYSNRNQSTLPNGGAGAASAYSNRNQSAFPNNGAAGAAYANRNNTTLPNGGAGAAGAAVGAGYANRNNSNLPYGGAGAAGAGLGAAYANNNNGYNGLGASAVGAGYWNGNNSGAWGMGGYGPGSGGVAAWGAGSPMYGWGYSGYSNPYAGGYSGSGGGQGVVADATQPPGAAPANGYAQPISTTSAPPEPAAADRAASAFAQARDAFKAGQYDQALQLTRQALAQAPDDVTMHQFLALVLFAQGQYEQAAAPLYAVLSVGPGWDWTTLSGMYPDVDTYTGQLRKLESYVRANTDSARARFVLAYQYLCQGHDEAAVAQLKYVVQLQPSDTLSAQLVAQYHPGGAAPAAPAPSASDATPGAEGKLAGKWSAAPASGANIALAIGDDGQFTWTASAPGRPATTIAGTSTLADGVLTLAAATGKDGALAGKVAWQDAGHFTFRLVGGPAGDPGLKFGR